MSVCLSVCLSISLSLSLSLSLSVCVCVCVYMWRYVYQSPRRFGSRLRVGGELSLAELSVPARPPLAATGADGGAPAVLADATALVMRADAGGARVRLSLAYSSTVAQQCTLRAFYSISIFFLNARGQGAGEGAMGDTLG